MGPRRRSELLLILGLEVNLLTLRDRGRKAAAVAAARWCGCSLAAAPGALIGVVVLRALPELALQIAVTVGVAWDACWRGG